MNNSPIGFALKCRTSANAVSGNNSNKDATLESQVGDRKLAALVHIVAITKGSSPRDKPDEDVRVKYGTQSFKAYPSACVENSQHDIGLECV